MPMSGELKKLSKEFVPCSIYYWGELAIVICQFEDYLRIFLA